jgi:cytochrome c5
MATSLYFVWGCSEFKNEQAVGAETAQAEDAMTAASEAEPSKVRYIRMRCSNCHDGGRANTTIIMKMQGT